jgi:hypothetical protein
VRNWGIQLKSWQAQAVLVPVVWANRVADLSLILLALLSHIERITFYSRCLQSIEFNFSLISFFVLVMFGWPL